MSDNNNVTCPQCGGKGSKKDKDNYDVACTRCGGIGTVKRGY